MVSFYPFKQGTFTTVTGTFTVPTPSNPDSGLDWVSAAAWVGIDGSTCASTILQTGVDFTVDNGRVSYDGEEPSIHIRMKLIAVFMESLVRMVPRP